MENEQIAVQDLQKRIHSGHAPVLVDTLTNDHYQQIHIPHAINACVFEVNFLDQIADQIPDKAAPIVVYGSRAETRDAEMAAGKLVRAGYTRVAILAGGLDAWRTAGYDLAGDSPETDEASEAIMTIEKRLYEVDTENSVIEWVGRNPNTHHTGSLRLTKGYMDARTNTPSGRFIIDLASIRNTSLVGDELQPVLIAHLLSDDFFWSDRFPTVNYELARMTPIDGSHGTAPNYSIDGALEMLGVRAALQFPATLTVLPDGRLAAEAHFDIDRTRWNIIYGSNRFFDHLGMHVVFDLISIQLKLTTR